MGPIGRLNELRKVGRLCWFEPAAGWTAEPDDVLSALSNDGFEACKHEEVRDRHQHSRGGVWQGVNPDTGAVAAAVWIAGDSRGPLIFIDIDGEPVRQG